MSKNKEYELAIKIAGEIEKSFYESTKLTKKELQDMAKQAAKAAEVSSGIPASLRSKFQSGLNDAKPFFTGLEDMARTSFKAIAGLASAAGLGITTGLGLAVSVGSEFESAFAGVKKTVDASDVEIMQMRDDLRQMAKEMPTSAAELSAIAESAGQLGIETGNITEFTRTMADLAVATNLTSDEAAAEFAKFANITGMAQDNFDELGSSVVALGNNLATNEADIVSMGMRIGAAGDQVGLSQAQIMAYSAALSSVGIEAEAGGSAFSKMLVNLQMATETGEGLKGYAKVAGMTGAEFKKAFQQDATGAINAFLVGLNDTERNGKSAIAVLDDMGLTEVRLRDTLLRAANASDLFENALSISNESWEENVALANEAAQRYITFESQTGMLNNKIKDIGISIYDDLRPGLTDTMVLANEFVDSIAGQEDVFGSMISSAAEGLPTMAREMREAGKAVREFAEPFLNVGGWLVDNPGVIVGAVSSIGASLVTYKVASGVMSLATSLGALGPVGMGILGLGGVAGVIFGIGTAVKRSAAEAKRANLAAHFGDIVLSMKDLQETASFIVHSESLDQIRDSVAAMGELDGISQDIKNAADELNKANWKVSIGMELTDQEKESYRSQAEEFVRATQEYVTQRQYGVSLAVTTLLGDDLESNNVVNQLNEFYSGKQAELASLGTELNKVITDAFTDGLLDMDEVAEIAKLQEQMAHIKSALAGSDFEAGLDLIGMKYTGQALDSDSFINLQAEIREQMETATAAYDEAFKTSMSEYRMMLSDGEWTQAQFDSAAADLNAGYLQQKTDLQVKAIQFQVNTIRQAYGEELDGVIAGLQAEVEGPKLGEMLEHVASGGPNAHIELLGDDIMDSIIIDQSTRDAMAEMFEQMKPEMEELQEIEKQCREAGQAVPEAVRKGLSEMGTIGALAGDMDALWALIGVTAQSPEYQDTLMAIRDAGGYIPEELANAILDNQDVINGAILKSWIGVQQIYSQTFGSGLGASMPINVGAESVQSIVKTGHADGGIFNTPHVAWFAENGPEAAIPIDGSRNAIDLWKTTGELLGMDGLTGGAEPIADSIENAALSSGFGQSQFVFSPTLQFYGDSPSKEDIEDVLETEQEKFARMFEQYLKDNNRLSFA